MTKKATPFQLWLFSAAIANAAAIIVDQPRIYGSVLMRGIAAEQIMFYDTTLPVYVVNSFGDVGKFSNFRAMPASPQEEKPTTLSAPWDIPESALSAFKAYVDNDVPVDFPPWDSIQLCKNFNVNGCPNLMGTSKFSCENDLRQEMQCGNRTSKERSRRHFSYACSSVLSRPFYEYYWDGNCGDELNDEMKKSITASATTLETHKTVLAEVQGKEILLSKQVHELEKEQQHLSTELAKSVETLSPLVKYLFHMHINSRMWNRRHMARIYFNQLNSHAKDGTLSLGDFKRDLKEGLISNIRAYKKASTTATITALEREAPLFLESHSETFLQPITPERSLQGSHGLEHRNELHLELHLSADIPILQDDSCRIIHFLPIVLQTNKSCLSAPRSFYSEVVAVECAAQKAFIVPKACLAACSKRHDLYICQSSHFCQEKYYADWLEQQKLETGKEFPLIMHPTISTTVEQSICDNSPSLIEIDENTLLLIRPATVTIFSVSDRKSQQPTIKRKFDVPGYVFHIGCSQSIQANNERIIHSHGSACKVGTSILFLKIKSNLKAELKEITDLDLFIENQTKVIEEIVAQLPKQYAEWQRNMSEIDKNITYLDQQITPNLALSGYLIDYMNKHISLINESKPSLHKDYLIWLSLGLSTISFVMIFLQYIRFLKLAGSANRANGGAPLLISYNNSTESASFRNQERPPPTAPPAHFEIYTTNASKTINVCQPSKTALELLSPTEFAQLHKEYLHSKAALSFEEYAANYVRQQSSEQQF